MLGIENARYIDSYTFYNQMDQKRLRDRASIFSRTEKEFTQQLTKLEEARRYFHNSALSVDSAYFADLTELDYVAISTIAKWLQHPLLDALDMEAPSIFERAFAIEMTGLGPGEATSSMNARVQVGISLAPR